MCFMVVDNSKSASNNSDLISVPLHMENSMSDSKITAANYDHQLAALKEAASGTVDPCFVAKYIAAADSRVRDLFIQKIDAEFVFRGVHCVDRLGIPENKYVVFDFDCIPGALCLVPPAFMVVVNIVDRYVVAIVDPYIPYTTAGGSSGSCGCDGASSPTSTRSNSNCVDVTIGDGKACLNVPYAGSVCISVPNHIPNGTVAAACIDTCTRFGVLCGAEVSIRVAGVEVASSSWGCC